MNNSTLRLLGFVVAILVVTLVVLESGENGESPASGALLFPDLRAMVNDVDHLTITKSGVEPIALEKVSGEWWVTARDGYAADMSDVRAVLLAMTEAKILEEKTANPEMYERLGVQGPDIEGGKGTLVSAAAGERSFDVVFGNSVRGSARYARIADQAQSWLIDQNPTIPEKVGEWLSPEIVDLDSADVSAVTIVHPDGETLRISKQAAEDTDFEVADIPDGRELSYSTVANGIAGALNNLMLDDVRKARPDSGDAIVTRFDTFTGLAVQVRTVKADDENWIAIRAEGSGDAAARADEINERVNTWQYRIADYKANLLTRRWADILKAEEPAEGKATP